MPLISTKDLIIALAKGIFVFWKIWLLIGAMAVVKFALILWERYRFSKSGIAEIDRMDGLTFEKYLKVLFEKLGYGVERTQYTGDYGADLITSKDAIKTVIQAKRYEKGWHKGCTRGCCCKGKVRLLGSNGSY